MLLLSLLVVNLPSNYATGFSLFGLDAVPGMPVWQLSISDGILFMAMASFFFDLLIYFKEKK